MANSQQEFNPALPLPANFTVNNGRFGPQLSLFIPKESITHLMDHFQNSHRRCLCACACFTFGLAYELWAQIDIEDAKKEEALPEKEDRIKRTPDKPNDKGEPVESIKDKNYGKPISQFAKDAVVTKMMNLSKKYPTTKDTVVNKFKKMFDITAEGIGPDDIRTAEQGKALTLLINEIDSTL